MYLSFFSSVCGRVSQEKTAPVTGHQRFTRLPHKTWHTPEFFHTDAEVNPTNFWLYLLMSGCYLYYRTFTRIAINGNILLYIHNVEITCLWHHLSFPTELYKCISTNSPDGLVHCSLVHFGETHSSLSHAAECGTAEPDGRIRRITWLSHTIKILV